MKHVYIDVSENGRGELQLSIGAKDIRGNGDGYRIAGAKFDGTGRVLLRHELSSRDVTEIRSYLRRMPRSAKPAKKGGPS